MNSSVTVGVTGQSGFSDSVTITASTLPAGVTVSPASLIVKSGASGQLTITATSNASTGAAQITFNG
jgi:hypothetical protein